MDDDSRVHINTERIIETMQIPEIHDRELAERMHNSELLHDESKFDMILKKLDKIAYHLEVIGTVLAQDRADRLVEEMMREATSEEQKI